MSALHYPRCQYRQKPDGRIETRILRDPAEEDASWAETPAAFAAAPPPPPGCAECAGLQVQLEALKRIHVALATEHDEMKADYAELLAQQPAAEEPQETPPAEDAAEEKPARRGRARNAKE